MVEEGEVSGRGDGSGEEEEAAAEPAEDPYVRLVREREREWRGMTLQVKPGPTRPDPANRQSGLASLSVYTDKHLLARTTNTFLH